MPRPYYGKKKYSIEIYPRKRSWWLTGGQFMEFGIIAAFLAAMTLKIVRYFLIYSFNEQLGFQSMVAYFS